LINHLFVSQSLWISTEKSSRKIWICFMKKDTLVVEIRKQGNIKERGSWFSALLRNCLKGDIQAKWQIEYIR
jgi:hypothetical protein